MALLKCTNAYPAPPDEMNLHTTPHLSEAFGVPTDLSDHTLGIAVPVAAVALGACIIENILPCQDKIQVQTVNFLWSRMSSRNWRRNQDGRKNTS